MIRPLALLFATLAATSLQAEFKAGAAVIDITPPKLPVLVNGGMLSRYVDKIKTRVNARAIVVSDGKSQIAIVVADSCMMSREVLDDAKAMAAKKTVASVHKIVALGELDPESVITPGIFVTKIVRIDHKATEGGGFK